MQAPGQTIPALGIIFDSDVGKRAETALALAVLYGLDTKNDARVLALTVTTPSLAAAAYCDAVAKFYAAGGFSRSLPVGLGMEDGAGVSLPLLEPVLAKKKPDGAPVYPHAIEKLNDTAIVGAVIRNAFTANHDGNAAAVLAGPATNYASVLNVGGASDWIAKKCRHLVVSDRTAGDVASAKKLFAEWPSPIVVVSDQAGREVLFPASAMEQNFAWAQNHPVLDVWKAEGGKDLFTHDLAAVLFAVRPQENYFTLSDPGTISVSDDGRLTLTAAANGKHRMLSIDPAQKDRVQAAYVQLASVKPVPRQRLRPPQAKKPKPDAPEPAPPKPIG